MSNKVCLICLVGLPAAGKTYLARALSCDKIGFSRVELVSFDDFENLNKSEMVWKEKRKAVFTIVEIIATNFINNRFPDESLLIILDDNMYYRSMRYEFYRLAKKMKYKYCQVYLDIPVEECFKRNHRRLLSLPKSHIVNMNEKLEKPSKNIFWEKESLTITKDMGLPDCLRAIEKLISECKEPEEAENRREKSSKKEMTSHKHLTDLALRKIVSQLSKLVKDLRTDDVPSRIAEIVENKRKILHSVNSGQITLPYLATLEDYIEYFIPIFHETLGLRE